MDQQVHAQAQGQQQLQPTPSSLDHQAAQLLSSMGSADLASLLSRRDLAAPVQTGSETTGQPGGGEAAFLHQQQQHHQQQQQQQQAAEQWRAYQQEQLPALSGPQSPFLQAGGAPSANETLQQQLAQMQQLSRRASGQAPQNWGPPPTGEP